MVGIIGHGDYYDITREAIQATAYRKAKPVAACVLYQPYAWVDHHQLLHLCGCRILAAVVDDNNLVWYRRLPQPQPQLLDGRPDIARLVARRNNYRKLHMLTPTPSKTSS